MDLSAGREKTSTDHPHHCQHIQQPSMTTATEARKRKREATSVPTDALLVQQSLSIPNPWQWTGPLTVSWKEEKVQEAKDGDQMMPLTEHIALLACVPSLLGYDKALFDNDMVAVELSTATGIPSLLYCPEAEVLFWQPASDTTLGKTNTEEEKEQAEAAWCVVSTVEVRMLIQRHLDKTPRRPRSKKLVEISYTPCCPSTSRQQIILVPLEDLRALPGVRVWTWPVPEALPPACQTDSASPA
jgi:hypothetical protein